MVVFDKCCRTAQSSTLHTTETVSVTDGTHTVNGSKYHRVGPETEKLLCPYLTVLHQLSPSLYDIEIIDQYFANASPALTGTSAWFVNTME